MTYHYITPGGRYYPALDDIVTTSPHLLIGGTTGAGKSTLLHSIIYSLMCDAPDKSRLILIDLKRVELYRYRSTPFCLSYADTPATTSDALRLARDMVESRLADMRRRGLSLYDGGDVYIIIDELAELRLTCSRSVLADLSALAVIARAARVHIVACTQRPTRDIIGGAVAACFDTRITLRCATAQESRNMMGKTGAELLPRYGSGYLLRNGYITPVSIPKTPDQDIAERVRWWQDPTHYAPAPGPTTAAPVATQRPPTLWERLKRFARDLTT